MDGVGVDKRQNPIVTVREEFFRPTEVDYLLGDCAKARKALGWTPVVTFEELVAMMARADLEHIKKKYGTGTERR